MAFARATEVTEDAQHGQQQQVQLRVTHPAAVTAIRDRLEEGDQIGIGAEINGGRSGLGHREWAGPGSKSSLNDGAKGGLDRLSGVPASPERPLLEQARQEIRGFTLLEGSLPLAEMLGWLAACPLALLAYDSGTYAQRSSGMLWTWASARWRWQSRGRPWVTGRAGWRQRHRSPGRELARTGIRRAGPCRW